MTKKYVFAEGWLYADNQLFAIGDSQKPVNENEILDNLKRMYGIYDISFLKRIPLIISSSLLSLIIGGFVLKSFHSIYYELIEKNIINIFTLVFMLSIMLIALYTCLLLTFRLCFPRTKRIDMAWSLLNYGIILDGYIVDQSAQSLHSVEVTYQFNNPVNKSIQGKYQYTMSPTNLPDYFRRKIDSPNSVEHHIPHPRPKAVKVWYANDKIHTLL